MAIAMVVALAAAGAAGAEGAGNDGAIRQVIDDLARAFDYASPGIQHLFGTAENFGTMVQGGYPMVWRPGSVRYLGLRQDTGGPVERVLTTDAAGRGWLLDYRMVQIGGDWRIDGVSIEPQAGPGV